MRSRRDPVVNRHALKALRIVAGLTQTQLAERVDIHSAHLSRIEAGTRKRPEPALTARMAEALGVPLDAILAAEPRGVHVDA